MPSGISDKNRKLLEILNRTQKGPFTAVDASSVINLPIKETSLLLTYFTTKEWLARIKRGLYITVPLGAINHKAYKENPWVVADKVFSPCYIGGWSAAEHWGLTEQIFNTVIAVSTRRPQKKNMTIQGTNFIIKYVNKKYFSQTTSAWIDNNKIQISNPSQTIVDILDDPSIGGGIRNIADMIKEYFISEFRNNETLLEYINNKNNKTIYKRLGYLIEARKIDAINIRKICKENISSGYSLLDPSIKDKGTCNNKWQLRINIRVEK